MPTITFAKQPETLELAYGKNIVSLYDTDEDGLTYVARLHASGAASASFEVRQSPNMVGYGHFDLQNLLKTQVEGNPYLESIAKLTTSSYETYEYQIKAGYVGGTNNTVIIQTSSSLKYVFNGRKDVTAVDWVDTEYVPKLNSGSLAGIDFVTVVSVQKALTDRHIDSVLGSAITDGKPSWLGASEVVWKLNRQPDDHYTLSFLNAWDNFSNGAPTYHNGIAAFRIAIYSGSTELYNDVITNIVSNGGGPNTAASGQSGSVFYPYKAISIQAGDLNTLFDTYATATHYYIATTAWSTKNFSAYAETSDIYRFDIDECVGNDFDGVQVSWVNSFGFRDYFHFTKRVDNRASITRKTFDKLDANWGGTSITVDSAARGEQVYNQSYEEQYTINTRYLTDVEAAYLKNLYLSPDIRVRFKGQNTWVSVIPTTNEWTSRTFKKDKLFQYSLGFKFANPIQLQRG
jgi:hypothetical protein